VEIFDEIEERYIETNGIKLHTVIIGEGEPILFMHGFPDFWYGWKNLILGLKDEYKLILPDTRGINLSDKPEGIDNYYPKTLIDDIKGLSEALNLGRFTLVGHDWGGSLAFGFATLYPELLKGLVTMNCPHPALTSRKIQQSQKKMRKTMNYQLDALKPGRLGQMTSNNFAGLRALVFKGKDKFDQEKYIEAWSQPGSLNNGLNYYRAAYKYTKEGNSVENWVSKIDVPTLIIWGMKDAFLKPVILEGLEDYIKDLKIVRIEKGSHFVMDDDPELVVKSIREFVKR
jgi:pimeloyl-ACP methyl ester carboxylesterase